MKGDVFWVLSLLPLFHFFPLLILAAGSTLTVGLGFLLLSFFRSLFLLFYFIFCCHLVDSLVRNPLPTSDLFGLRTDLIKSDLFFFVLPLLPSFVLVFFLYSFLLQVLLLLPVPCAMFLSFVPRLFFFALCRPRSLLFMTY
jgi:hypothetical protein